MRGPMTNSLKKLQTTSRYANVKNLMVIAISLFDFRGQPAQLIGRYRNQMGVPKVGQYLPIWVLPNGKLTKTVSHEVAGKHAQIMFGRVTHVLARVIVQTRK